jgi:hypothetical protein
VPVIALEAASAVGLGVAVGLTVASNDASADTHALNTAILKAGGGCVDAPDDYADECSELHRLSSRVEAFGNGARVSYLASGVLVIAAVTHALWPRTMATPSSHVRALPELRIGSAGIVVLGTW